MILNNKYEYNPRTDQLGKGGFGTVFKAADTILNRAVALKLVDRNNLPAKYSLVAEISRVIDLNHPNLVRYYDAFIYTATDSMGQETEVQVGVMEYVNGGDLKQFCGHPNIIPDLNELLKGILAGLTYLHSNGIIHRDIKPQNILLQKEHGKLIPKISDFGISKNIGDAGSTVSGLVGSQAYMSPEQLNNTGGKLSPATDIWAFGILVYELFTGERPFDKPGVTSDVQIITNIVECRLPDRMNIIPEPYRSIIRACVCKELKLRISSTIDVSAMFDNTAEQTQIDSEATKVEAFRKDEFQKKTGYNNIRTEIGEADFRDKSKQTDYKESIKQKSSEKKRSRLLIPAILLLLLAGYFLIPKQERLEDHSVVKVDAVVENGPAEDDLDSISKNENNNEINEEKSAQLIEKEAWDRAKEINTSSAYEDYLKDYPSGQYADFAKNEISVIKEQKNKEKTANALQFYNEGLAQEKRKNYNAALAAYKQASSLGNNDAQNKIGIFYYKGSGVEKNYDTATVWFRKANKGGWVDYMKGKNAYLKDDYSEALRWYLKSAEQGNSFAQVNLGSMYYAGDGVAQDYKEAVNWFYKAAVQGLASAQSNMGVMYERGNGVAQDYHEAINWYLKAADQDDVSAQNKLADMYYYGDEIPEDDKKAAKWYRKSAELGDAHGQYRLGVMYENGYGMVRNSEEAANWYEKAANNNNRDGMEALGEFYLFGLGGKPKSKSTAISWFQKARSKGNRNAVIALKVLDEMEQQAEYRYVSNNGDLFVITPKNNNANTFNSASDNWTADVAYKIVSGDNYKIWFNASAAYSNQVELTDDMINLYYKPSGYISGSGTVENYVSYDQPYRKIGYIYVAVSCGEGCEYTKVPAAICWNL